MSIKRRSLLKNFFLACVGACARNLGIVAVTATPVVAAATAVTGANGKYGKGVRQQVFEVIVRQAMAGAPWKQICKGPMEINNISEQEIELELSRRKLKHHIDEEGVWCYCQNCSNRRTEQYREYYGKLSAIPHSEQAPCACQTCRMAIDEITEAIRKESYA